MEHYGFLRVILGILDYYPCNPPYNPSFHFIFHFSFPLDSPLLRGSYNIMGVIKGDTMSLDSSS